MLNSLKNTVLIQMTMFLHCGSRSDGGIFLANGFKGISVKDSKFKDCFSFSFGGVFYVYQFLRRFETKLMIANTIFTGIEALNDGGVIYAENIIELLIFDCKFENIIGQNAGAIIAKFLNTVSIMRSEFRNTSSLDSSGALLFEKITSCVVNSTKLISSKAVSSGSFMKISEGEYLFEGCFFSSSKNDRNTHIEIQSKIYTKLKFASTDFFNCTGNSSLIYLLNHNLFKATFLVFFENNTFNYNILANIIVAHNPLFTLSNSFFSNNFALSSIINQFEGDLLISKLKGRLNSMNSFIIVNLATDLNIDGFDTKEKEIKFSEVQISKVPNVSINNFLFVFPAIEDQKYWFNVILLRASGQVSFRFLKVLGIFSQSYSVEFLNSENCAISFQNCEFIEVKTNTLPFFKGLFFNENLAFSNLIFRDCDISSFEISIKEKSLISFIGVIKIDEKSEEVSNDFSLNIKGNTLSTKVELLNSYFSGNRFVFLLTNITNTLVKNLTLHNIHSCKESPFIFLYNLKVSISNVDIKNISKGGGMSFRFPEETVDINSPKSLEIKDSLFIGSENQSPGGAISIYGSVYSYFWNVSFHNCISFSKAGALYLRSEVEESGFIEFMQTSFANNLAAWSGGAISLTTPNKKIIELMSRLLTKDNNNFTNNTSYEFKHSEPISSFSIQFSYKISSEKYHRVPLEFNGSLENSALQKAPFNFTFYSGESINLEIKFYDNFWNPIDDLHGLTLICEVESLNKNKYYYLYKNNRQIIVRNVVNISNMKLISLNFETENLLKCFINGVKDNRFSSDHLFSQINIIPINATQTSCTIGQILRENECKVCKNSYSFTPKPSVYDNCRPCPENADCFEGYLVLCKQGYWNWNTSSLKIFKCKPDHACLKGEAGYSTKCGVGYEGNLCKECKFGYGKSFDESCILCSDGGLVVRELAWHVLKLIILIFEFMIFLPNKSSLENLKDLLFSIRKLLLFVDVFSIIFAVKQSVEEDFLQFYGFLSVFSFFRANYFSFDCIFNSISLNAKFICLLFWTLAHPFIYLFFALLVLNIFKTKDLTRFLKIDKFRLAKLFTVISMYHFIPNIIYHCTKPFFCFELLPKSGNFYMIGQPNILCSGSFYSATLLPISICILGTYFFVIGKLRLDLDKQLRDLKSKENKITYKELELDYFQDYLSAFKRGKEKTLDTVLVFIIILLTILVATQSNASFSEKILRTILLIPLYLLLMFGIKMSLSNLLFFFNFLLLTISCYLNIEIQIHNRSTLIKIFIALYSLTFCFNILYLLSKIIQILKARSVKRVEFT